MTAQTSRYHIQYPTGSDLVSNIPQHMQNAANSIEAALADVDDRHTTAAYTPVVREWLLDLRSAPGASRGQIGYTYATDRLYNGPWFWDGGYWRMIGTRDITSYCTNVINTQFWTVPRLSVTLIGQHMLITTLTVQRKSSEWRGNGSTDNGMQRVLQLPSTIACTNLVWSPFDPRFGASAHYDANGTLWLTWDGTASNNRAWPANQNIDFMITQQVSFKG